MISSLGITSDCHVGTGCWGIQHLERQITAKIANIDYLPGPEEPEQAPPSPIYVHLLRKPCLRRSSYSRRMRGVDDDDDAEDEHLAPAEHCNCWLIHADQDPLQLLTRHGIRLRDALPPRFMRLRFLSLCFPLSAGSQDADGLEELGYGIRVTWDDFVGAIQEICTSTLEGDQQRVIECLLLVDQEDEIHICSSAVLMEEEEARLSRAAWAQSIGCGTRLEGRQYGDFRAVKAVIGRQRQLVEALKIVKSLKTQMIELQRQQGPAQGYLAELEATRGAKSRTVL
ncbi:hypothetical protein Tco_0210677 [Tanacetum coccineum]